MLKSPKKCSKISPSTQVIITSQIVKIQRLNIGQAIIVTRVAVESHALIVWILMNSAIGGHVAVLALDRFAATHTVDGHLGAKINFMAMGAWSK